MGTSISTVVTKYAPWMAVALVVIEIVLTNRFAGIGRLVRGADAQIDVLRRENALLEQKVASASSLVTIAARAGELGLIEPSKSQYLTLESDIPVALNSRQ